MHKYHSPCIPRINSLKRHKGPVSPSSPSYTNNTTSADKNSGIIATCPRTVQSPLKSFCVQLSNEVGGRLIDGLHRELEMGQERSAPRRRCRRRRHRRRRRRHAAATGREALRRPAMLFSPKFGKRWRTDHSTTSPVALLQLQYFHCARSGSFGMCNIAGHDLGCLPISFHLSSCMTQSLLIWRETNETETHKSDKTRFFS